MSKCLEAKILRIDDKKALLEIDHQHIFVSSDTLPKKALPGERIKLYLLNPEETISSDKKFAKVVLEEILNGK